MQVKLNPYLLFNGQAKAAMEFYSSILGGELKLQTFGESGMPGAEKEKDLIIHAQLTVDDMVIMASDSGHGHEVEFGSNVALSLVGPEEKELTEIFEKLSHGGKVDLKLEKQFWGDIYGQLTDKFGVHWMVNISSPESSVGT
jgi:PhnB protein